jgi:hypothetical protein
MTRKYAQKKSHFIVRDYQKNSSQEDQPVKRKSKKTLRIKLEKN